MLSKQWMLRIGTNVDAEIAKTVLKKTTALETLYPDFQFRVILLLNWPPNNARELSMPKYFAHICIYLTPPHEQDATQGQFLIGV